MLERHLYDTMPEAWHALGHDHIPAPIPKAAKIGARRHSYAVGPPQSTVPMSSLPMADVGRILTRQESNRLQESNFGNNDKTTQKLIARRQSIQVDKDMVKSFHRSPSIDAFRSIKRKVNDDDLLFKKPTAPPKMRKVAKVSIEPIERIIDPAILLNAAAINKMASCGTVVKKLTNKRPSAPAQPVTPAQPVVPTQPVTPTCSVTPTRPAAALPRPVDVSPPKKQRKVSTDCRIKPPCAFQAVHMTDMSVLFNAVIDKNAARLNEYIRSSLVGMLNEFWDATNTTQQVEQMQNQMNDMRSIYNGQIDGYKQEIDCLQLELQTSSNARVQQSKQIEEVTDENTKLNDALAETKEKLTDVTKELKKANTK